MSELSDSELSAIAQISPFDGQYSLLTITTTGFKKSILDATKDVRNFLSKTSIHDFENQLQGVENKRSISCLFIQPNGDSLEELISFNRPKSGNGDPRLWSSGFRKIASAGETICLFLGDEKLRAINISKLSEIESSLPEQSSAGIEEQKDQKMPDATQPTNKEDSSGFWETLEHLWERSTGGSDVAARPGNEDTFSWPVGPEPAGVSAAIQWFDSTSVNTLPRLLFLVGGPGGGKSFTASRLVNKLKEIDPIEDGLAHRTHKYLSDNLGEVILVNDATIGSDEYQDQPLSSEISHSLFNDASLIACVNRGILVEETKNSTPLTAATFLLNWLAGERQTENQIDNFAIDTTFDSDFLISGLIKNNGESKAVVTAVFVDSCSLFEKVPTVNFLNGESEKFTGDKYRIRTFDERKNKSIEDFPAGFLLKETLGLFTLEDSFEDHSVLNPIKANMESLAHENIQRNLLTVMRASELASSSKFTYREVWGIITRTLIGNAPSIMSSGALRNYIHSNQPTSNSPLQDFEVAMKLCGFRLSQSIFGAGSDTDGDVRTDPVLKISKNIDPILDSEPGFYDGTEQNGWATPIIDAFSGPLTEGSPLDSVLSMVPSSDAIHQMVTDFDKEVDRLFVKAMQFEGTDFKVRSNLISWYSMYISRLYAVANGICAFLPQISTWLNLWKMSPNFPSESVEKQFVTLIRPPRVADNPNSSSLLPLFDSRTAPLRGEDARSKLAIRVNDVKLKTSRNGDSMFLHLEEHDQSVSKILLDFPLVRQAMACIPGNPGVTELSKFIAPRLERVRAARLTPNLLAGTDDLRVVVGNEESTFTLSGESE